ncbi:MAG: hypothetical protein AABX17_01885 [Nanoarchaeota archaeon]
MVESTALKTMVRTKCPFYGFALFRNIMVDSRGNQCTLLNGYAPCQMERASKSPDWVNCGFNVEVAQKGLAELLENGRIFPEELKPADSKSWKGINFKDWYNHILDGKEIPGYASS